MTTTTDEDRGHTLRLRIVNVDHYLSEPTVRFDDVYSLFRETDIKRVPVLRVFGTTDDGRKACLHIHKVYPYLSVKYDARRDNCGNKNDYIKQLVNSMESNIFPQRVRTRNVAKDVNSDQLVFDVQEVDSIPFYGYHENYEKFLRIYFYNPFMIQKVSEQLLSGEIMDRQIQPHEAHLNYTLQFFIDNNLYGMNFLEAKHVIFRKTESLPENVDYSDIEPMSSCQLECDIDYRDIINRETMLDNQRIPGLEAIWREALNNCKDSQELLNLNANPSQERTDITVNEREAKLIQELFDGLAKLDIKQDYSQNSGLSLQLSSFNEDINENDFADIVVNCIDDKNDDLINKQISETIETVINNSQTLTIIQTIEDVINDSQKSQKIKQKSIAKRNKRKSEQNSSRRRLVYISSTDGDTDVSTEIDDTIDEICEPKLSYVDAGTQTDIKTEFDNSLDPFLNSEQEVEEVVCDCDSDECCDQCCDRGSDQCECDCERCEYEKCKRIPQLDGMFDSDSGSASDFKPNYKEDSGDDSDFEMSSKKNSKKKGKKRPQTSGRSNKRKKKYSNASDSDNDLLNEVYRESKTTPKRRASSSKRQASPSPSIDKDDNEDAFESSSGRKVKPSKNLSSRLWDRFKPSTAKKSENETLHMSFSESEGEEKNTTLTSFLSDFSAKPKQNSKAHAEDDNRSERSVTPYLSNESEDEKPPKMKAGPKSSKSDSVSARPGPKSSKSGSVSSRPGPKSSKISATNSKPGPKSSKAGPKSSKPGPKSSKRRDSLISDNESDVESDLFTTSTSSRSRRNTSKSVNYDDTIERTTSIYTEETKSKTKATSNRSKSCKSAKSELDSALDSITSYVTPYESSSYTTDYLSSDLVWKIINTDIISYDGNYYDKDVIETVGFEQLDIKFTPDYIVNPYLRRYEENVDYWKEMKIEVKHEIENGITNTSTRGGTKSKGALKEFYTLPQLNDYKTESKTNEKTVKKVEPKTPKTTISDKKSNNSTVKTDRIARLLTEASYIVDKPLSKRVSQPKVIPKTKDEVVVKKALPKRAVMSSKSKPTKKSSVKSGSTQKSRSRVQRGVTSSTVFNTISLPFYDSDIKHVTQLSGHKKLSYLKSLCDDFEVDVTKLPDHYRKSYAKHKISPLLFDNIYYNDYSGHLSNEESQDTQDVLIVMKNLINDVVSVSQCVDSVVRDIANELEPKPMIDTQEEEFFEDMEPSYEDNDDWNYDTYNEEQDVIGIAVDENGEAIGAVERNVDPFSDTQKIEEPNIQGTNDSLSEILMETFGNNENDVSYNGEANTTQNNEQNNENCMKIQVNEYQEIEKSIVDKPTYGEDINENICQTLDESNGMCEQSNSPIEQVDGYSNNNNSNECIEQNTPHFQSNPCVEAEEEDNEESDNEEDNNEMITEMNYQKEHQMTAPNPLRQYRIHSTTGAYASDGYNYSGNQSQQFQQNPLQNPIVPTLPIQNNNSSTFVNTGNIYSGTQNWSNNQQSMQSMGGQQLHYNMSSQPTPQPDCEFDVDNYSYMPYYSNNSNIPQFDGIFDDDSFHSEGNKFNDKYSIDDTLEHLSQGSRSEEMSETVNKSISERVKEALLTGDDGHNVAKDNERYGYYINGVVVKIPKSLPESCLRQFGREVLTVKRSAGREFNEEDVKHFFQTPLIGHKKLHFLQSLCNKDIRICLKRLNFQDFNDKLKINFPYNSQFVVTSDIISSKQLYTLKDNFCSQNKPNVLINISQSNASDHSECSERPVSDKSIEMPDEIPESPLNDITNAETNDEISQEISSFHLDNTISPKILKSLSNTQLSNHTIDKVSTPITGISSNFKNHSTPVNSQKCKPFSQTLNESTKKFDFQLSNESLNTSKLTPNISQKSRAKAKSAFYRNDSIIEGPTLSNEFAFTSVDGISTTTTTNNDCDYQYLTTMSVEVHVSTRAKLSPDPQTDPIEAIFYSILCDQPSDDISQSKYITGVIIVEPDIEKLEFENDSFSQIRTTRRQAPHTISGGQNLVVDHVDDEVVLLIKFVEIVKQWDPDIVVGYKVDTLSWGYILKRANVLNMSIMTALSRINDETNTENQQNMNFCRLCGRITLNLWRIIRKEVTLTQYSYENVHFHVLHERIPVFNFEKLTQLYTNRYNHYNRRRVIDYYLTRAVGSLRLLDKLNFIERNSEFARLFGIQFQEVYYRGSQFGTESIMLRFTKMFDYIAVSPSTRQVHSQKAIEHIPMVLEPYSKYYSDPVVVLDFQSLYPSMMIAYNYCYSTCLGRVDQLIQNNDTFEFGCLSLEVKKQLLYKYRNDIHISPNGAVFLKKYVRTGILPKMLEEILDTRVMVKNQIKANNRKQLPNKALHRKLDARQQCLKNMANMTYGYTGASFSGRMPCVDIADAIVSKARETLERAINLVESRPDWGGKVVYGDTDSLFVHFPGLSKEEAFKRGHEIAEEVSQSNPKPVRLKFEKVYLPCVLQTKKRYVGFSYESPEQTIPKFDAKGTETVRRDSCPVVAKLLEKSLRILFQKNDLNEVKQYLFRQFQKILDGRVDILNDFVFAKEYKGIENYSDKSHVPSVEITKRKLAADPNCEPMFKERVPYVVICGAPNDSLYKLFKEPLELINDPSLRLNAQYYIERAIIPALSRVFDLIGHNVGEWYREMPKRIHYNRYQYLLGRQKSASKTTITHFFNTTQCIVCDSNSKGKDFCEDCQRNPHESIRSVNNNIRNIQLNYKQVVDICKQCTASMGTDIDCQSIECPNLYRYQQSKLNLMNANYLSEVLQKYF